MISNPIHASETYASMTDLDGAIKSNFHYYYFVYHTKWHNIRDIDNLPHVGVTAGKLEVLISICLMRIQRGFHVVT